MTAPPQISGIKLHQLRYFLVLAEELHFGRAADRLAITQPPLSAAIRALEDSLGYRLLDRDSRQVVLTQAGEAFRDEIRFVLQSVERAVVTGHAVAGGMKGRLELGMTGSLLYRGVPRVIERFHQRMPDVEITLREIGSSEQIEAVANGRLHAGFVNSSNVPDGLCSIRIPDDDFVCCVPSRHRLARLPEIAPEQIAHEDFIMFSREIAPDNHDNVISILRSAGISPHICHAARQWLTILPMVASGMGVALVPSTLARSGMAGVTFIPLAVAGLPPARALFVWPARDIPPSLAHFADCVRAEFETG